MSKRESWPIYDKYKLRTLVAGRTRFIQIESAAEVDNVQKRIITAGTHYYKQGYIPALVYTMKVIDKDENDQWQVGILYGLKKGHENE